MISMMLVVIFTLLLAYVAFGDFSYDRCYDDNDCTLFRKECERCSGEPVNRWMLPLLKLQKSAWCRDEPTCKVPELREPYCSNTGSCEMRADCQLVCALEINYGGMPETFVSECGCG